MFCELIDLVYPFLAQNNETMQRGVLVGVAICFVVTVVIRCCYPIKDNDVQSEGRKIEFVLRKCSAC